MKDTKVLLVRSVGSWHLEASIDLTDSWNVVRDERLKLGLKLDFLGLVSSDVIKKLFYFARHLQISIVGRIVSSGNIFVIITIVVVFSAL